MGTLEDAGVREQGEAGVPSPVPAENRMDGFGVEARQSTRFGLDIAGRPLRMRGVERLVPPRPSRGQRRSIGSCVSATRSSISRYGGSRRISLRGRMPAIDRPATTIPPHEWPNTLRVSGSRSSDRNQGGEVGRQRRQGRSGRTRSGLTVRWHVHGEYAVAGGSQHRTETPEDAGVRHDPVDEQDRVVVGRTPGSRRPRHPCCGDDQLSPLGTSSIADADSTAATASGRFPGTADTIAASWGLPASTPTTRC